MALTHRSLSFRRTVTNGFDAAQRISSVTGSFGGQTTNYISTAVYWPHGAPNYYVRGEYVLVRQLLQ